MEFVKDKKIVEIISRLLIGEISAQEQKRLDEWVAASEANRKCYQRIMSGQLFSEQAGILSHSNKENSLLKVQRNIQRFRIRRLVITALSSAAVVLLAVGLLFFAKEPRESEQLHLPEMASMPAGSAKAVLTYGDNQFDLYEQEQGSEWEKYIEKTGVETKTEYSPRWIKIEVPRGGEYNIRLGDGTQVWLNAASVLEYPDVFEGNERLVKLTGEAYFEVETDTEKPFIVAFADARVRVLGTSFNVSAYPDDAAATATLVSGKIRVVSGEAEEVLVPGKQAVIAKGVPEILVREVNTELYSLWKEGLFKFERMRLEEICIKLSRWYDVSFEFEGTTGDERFTGGTWKYLPLGELLSNIEMVTHVKFSYEGNKVIVSR